MTDISPIINRLKRLSYFLVEVELEQGDDLYFNGPLPFDVKIFEGVAHFNVLAASYEEAEERVYDYLDGPGPK